MPHVAQEGSVLSREAPGAISIRALERTTVESAARPVDVEPLGERFGDQFGLAMEGHAFARLDQVSAHAAIATFGTPAALPASAELDGCIELVAAVDPHRSNFQSRSDVEGNVHRLRPDARSQAVGAVVGKLDGLVDLAERHEHDHRPEDLVASDRVSMRDVREEGGGDEEPIGARVKHAAVRLPLGCSFCFAQRDEPCDLVELRARVHRADVDSLVERISHPQSRHLPLKELRELAGHTLLNDDAGASAARLSLVEEDGVDDTSSRGVQIRVFADDKRSLAASLERESNTRSGCCRPDLLGHGGRACEGDLADPRMTHECVPCGAVAVDDVDYPLGQADVDEDLREQHGRERR